MKALKRTAVIVALGLAAGGCSILDTKPVARESLKNAQGHVVGYKDVMRDAGTGEELAQIALFVPRLGTRGDWSSEGRLVWWWKNAIDRRWMRRLNATRR